MRRQRDTSQMNEQNTTPEKELDETEASDLPNAQFKTSVIRMPSDLGENFNKETGNKTELENIKENQSELEELSNCKEYFTGNYSRVDETGSGQRLGS